VALEVGFGLVEEGGLAGGVVPGLRLSASWDGLQVSVKVVLQMSNNDQQLIEAGNGNGPFYFMVRLV